MSQTVTHHRLCEQLEAEAVEVGEALARLTGEDRRDAERTLASIREDIAFFHPDAETCRKVSTMGIAFDAAWIDSEGTTHYQRHNALGGGAGPSSWSDEYDCNPVCGHHLAARCGGCGVCTDCDGCYCYEDY